MSAKLFQGIISQLKETTDRTVGVLDENGAVVACTDLSKIGTIKTGIKDELAYSADGVVRDGATYRNVGNGLKNDFSVFVEGEDIEAAKLCSVLSVTLGGMKNLYDDKYDKASFIKNIMLDNILPGDIYIKTRELHFPADAPRAVIFVRVLSGTDVNPFQTVQNMFPDRNKDFVISLSETDVAIVKEVREGAEIKDVEKIASGVSDTFRTEFYTNVTVGVGTIVYTVKDLARSFKESQLAIDVGKVFDIEKHVITYEFLGIGRLIYQLPTTLCELFLSEVFRNGGLDQLDRETLETIQCFFDNSLNVSETARKLFVHRNTLVYRLDKVKRLTGLDLREFDAAITFKVAMMVNKYLSSKRF